MKSTPATRQRRMDRAFTRAERAWDALHRAEVEFEAAWSQMPTDERRDWLDAHGMDHVSDHVHSGARIFRDLGA